MFLSRSAAQVARRAAVAPAVRRGFASTVARRSGSSSQTTTPEKPIQTLADVKTADDLFGPGAKPGTVPTDMEQATGLERLEILGKMEGVDVFDMRPLDSSRRGTLQDPILVRSAGDEQYAGCTGYPRDSHEVNWLTVSFPSCAERTDVILWVLFNLGYPYDRCLVSAPSAAAPSAARFTR
ncbi:hypothetical protein RB598_004462 [Gaeumannomyces tritici]